MCVSDTCMYAHTHTHIHTHTHAHTHTHTHTHTQGVKLADRRVQGGVES